MRDLWTTAKILVLFLPNVKQCLYLGWLEFAKRKVVLRAVTYDTRDPSGRLVAVNPRGRIQFNRRTWRNAGMVIIEDKGFRIVWIDHPAHARVARAKVAVGDVFRQLIRFMLHRAAAPGAVLAMGSNDYPLFPQRMPTLFPNHT